MRPTCCIYNRASQKKSKTLYTGYTPQSTVIPRAGYNMFNIPQNDTLACSIEHKIKDDRDNQTLIKQ